MENSYHIKVARCFDIDEHARIYLFREAQVTMALFFTVYNNKTCMVDFVGCVDHIHVVVPICCWLGGYSLFTGRSAGGGTHFINHVDLFYTFSCSYIAACLFSLFSLLCYQNVLKTFSCLYKTVSGQGAARFKQ